MTNKADSSGTPSILRVIAENCTLCYACIRQCPVNAIEVKTNETAVRISDERCIACGSCEMICPSQAIRILDEIIKIDNQLLSDRAVIALVDPSISAEFPDIHDYRNFVGMIRGLGFKGVYDVSFGVDLLAPGYRQLLADFKGKYWITSKCPAVISTVRKYYPALTVNLVPLLTPYAALAKFIRNQTEHDPYLVLITPCLAAYHDLSDLNSECRIDALLTFRDLRKMFSQHALNESTFEYSDFDSPPGGAGSLFPLANGLMQIAGISEALDKTNVISSCGANNMTQALDGFSDALQIRKHLDLFYCEGCFMGPGMSEQGNKFQRMTRVTDYAKKRIDIVSAEKTSAYIQKCSTLDFSREFAAKPQILPVIEESEIDDILVLVGKKSDYQSHRGCQACGYKSCREFAISVASGFAKPEMCLHYTSKNHNEYINNLRQTNDQLAKVQRALQESEQQAHNEKEIVREYAETLQALLQRIPSGVLVVNENLKVIRANKVLIEILGDEAISINEIIPGLEGADIRSLFPESIQGFFNFVLKNNQEVLHKDLLINNRLLNVSVFAIKKGSIIGAVIRDLSSPEVQKEELFTRITDVVDNNLEMVQKIGFLLGEGAAETERMLNSIIAYFKADQKG